MNKEQLEILMNIISGVESGGQIYGNRKYGAYAAAYANNDNEVTCTLGWAQNYGYNARTLCRRIFKRDPESFRKVDTAGIEEWLNKDWVSLMWNPTSKQKAALIAITTTETGKVVQDEMFEEIAKKYIIDAEAFGVTDVAAQMMWCEIEHLGGLVPTKRIFARAEKPYTPDTIYASLLLDQKDASNKNQVGDKVYQSRHQCCVLWIKQYLQGENAMKSWEKTEKLLAGEVGYLEKKSASNLDSKTANAGYKNYTKYAQDVNNWGKMGCQGQPWCAVYQFWICVNVHGLEKALEIMGNGFYNCNSVKAHAKAKGTWHSTPKLGALVIFRNGAHVGRVTKVMDDMIYTNEGNTSAGKTNNVEVNGGCVAEKVYTRNYSGIDGYVWIDYGTEPVETEMQWKATGTATATVDNLYVRAEPNGEIIGELMNGNRFEINGVTSGNWTQAKVANIGIGWVWTEYIQKDGTVNKNTVIKNKQDQKERLFVGEVTASQLNVRTWAGEEYPKIKSYPVLIRKNLVDVMNYTQTAADGSKWYFVRIADKYCGFVHSDYIRRV